MYRSVGKRRGRNKYLADCYFTSRNRISPMAAFFLALPVKEKQAEDCGEIIVKTDFVDMVIQAGSRVNEKGKRVYMGIPWGMPARRILLYVFSQAYKAECAGNFSHNIQLGEGAQSDFLRSLGYKSKTSFSSKHPAYDNFQSLIACEFDVARNDKSILLDLMKDTNEKCDFRDMHIFKELIYSKNTFKVDLNVKFPFGLDLPVDYEQATRLGGKTLAWNIYVFLADMLHRVPEDEPLILAWETVGTWFGSGYSKIRQFRSNFKDTLDNVLEVYPEAKGKVDLRRKDILTLEYAEPPIKHTIKTNSRFSYFYSPEYKELDPEFYNEEDQSHLLL